MANDSEPKKALSALSHRLIEMGRSCPPAHSYNRQLLRVLIDAVDADAATMWLVRENELILSEEIEQEGQTVHNIGISDEEQQHGLRGCFEQGQSVILRNATSEQDAGDGFVIFVPLSDVQGVRGVVRLIVGPVSDSEVRRITQLADVICGYYSLYSTQRLLSIKQEERKEIDRLSKSILQLQHYTFSHQLPDVLVNSAMEIVPADRVVLLSGGGDEQLRVEAVSSVVEKDKKSAWNKLVCELGELVLDGGGPVQYSPERQDAAGGMDDELYQDLDSYVLMTDVKSMLLFPLVSGKEEAGVLIFETFKDAQLTSFERVLCTMYATHAASAMGNHRVFDSVPFSGLYAKSIHKEEEDIKRGPFQFGRIIKYAAVIALIASIVWFAGFYGVNEKVDSQCFVAPFTTRTVTAKINGEIDVVNFEQGQEVEEGSLLLQLDTRDVQLRLRRAREEAENIRARISKLRGQAEDEEHLDRRGQVLAELGAREHELEAQKQEVKILEDRLKKCFLHAPIAGTILEPQDSHEMLGMTVKEGESLCRIGDIAEQVKVKVAIPGGRISEVAEGYEALISLRPLIEQKTIEGEISRILSRSVTYKESNVFMADVVVPRTVPSRNNPEKMLSLQPGMTGKAKIVIPGKTSYASIYARKLYRTVSYWLF